MRIGSWMAFMVALLLSTSISAATAQPSFVHLKPGQIANIAERVPVNYVFVGLEPTSVNRAGFLANLPATYEPVVRSRLWYGVIEKLGLRYTFDHAVHFTDITWENRFFAALAGMSTPAPRTLFQDLYNSQARNVVNVGQNYFIDAPAVEKWLIDNPPAGVNTRQNTIFFISWWGRPDFRFHVYTKFDEPDPDTGNDFGRTRSSRKVIAWGGTPPDDEETGLGSRGIHRLWFYDLSAGPESWSGSWNVDDADLDGDGVADYRIPPIWEYQTRNGYRPAEGLTRDLARLARFVGIDLLFTTSPLYPPYLTPNSLPASINLDSNTYEGWAGVDASALYQKPAMLATELSKLLAHVRTTVDNQDVGFAGEAAGCYVGWLQGVTCDPRRPYPSFANLFLYNAAHLTGLFNAGADYEAPLVNYANDDSLGADILGFADDNWIDGTQSFVFSFLSPAITTLGYGLTTTQIHETGHHLGMSHPHDGWDSELGIDFGPEGSTYFAWSGDETNSIMSYVDLNWDFSQFDRDNFNRFTSAAYITNANAIALAIIRSENPSAGLGDLHQADAEIGLAVAQVAAHDYANARQHAVNAYALVRTAATKSSVRIRKAINGWTLLPPGVGAAASRKTTYSHIDRTGPRSKRSAP